MVSKLRDWIKKQGEVRTSQEESNGKKWSRGY
jgi:hypothetical protein